MRNNRFMQQGILATHEMKTKTALRLALALAGLVSVNGASAQEPARMPAPPTSFTVDMSNDCAGGGTRVIEGSYDAASGALDTTTTLSGCVARNGDTFDGMTSTIGTLLATETGYQIKVTASVDTTIVRSDLSTVRRVCTVAKDGTFTIANQTFEGTTAQTNCSVTGKVLEHEGLVEHLLRAAQGLADGGGLDAGSRMIPPQRDEDRIRLRFDVPPINGIGWMGGMGGMGGRR